MAQQFCDLWRGERHVGFYRTPHEAREAARKLAAKLGETVEFVLFLPGDLVEEFTSDGTR